ncbi:hypothetical protein BDM02DRAFT_3188252 [Thelephora ganbajun]|uniref:Uncharacterized protein n=1 Tax=Thelephora ganbajun TaxID=370292 RepID=A0ACB6ZBN2_THEGA|nr:hypothetical protein BDM02DRAFT_3188252 [Thelephora ganbajun]
MGAKGSGKTSFVKMASGSGLHTGVDFEPAITQVQPSNEFVLDRKRVVLIDTPGFDDATLSDTDVLKMIAAFQVTTMFCRLCEDSTLKSVVIVANIWGEASKDVEEARERELMTNFFKLVLDKGTKLVRHHNTAQSAHDIIRCVTNILPIPPQIQSGHINEITIEEPGEQIRRYRAELNAFREETVKALREMDVEIRREFEQEIRKLRVQVESELGHMKMEMRQRLEEFSMATTKELEEQIRRHRAELEAVREEMFRTLREREEETRRELEYMKMEMRQREEETRRELEHVKVEMQQGLEETRRELEHVKVEMQQGLKETRRELEHVKMETRQRLEEVRMIAQSHRCR